MSNPLNSQFFPNPVITRFAPSPTGYLHLGHVLSALYVETVRRIKGGQVILRIEDHDQSRWRYKFEQQIISDLQFLGFSYDRVTNQRDRLALYARVLQKLEENDDVYHCYCSRKDLLQRLARRGAVPGELTYDGYCRLQRRENKEYCIRFKVSPEKVRFFDFEKGQKLQCPQEQCGDFPLVDRKGQYSYHFSNTVDDIIDEVNCIIRGEDLLASTGRQLLLREKIAKSNPFSIGQCVYIHHPLIMSLHDAEQKLAKSEQSPSLMTWRKQGYDSSRIWQLLAERLNWRQSVSSLDEAVTVLSADISVTLDSNIDEDNYCSWQ